MHSKRLIQGIISKYEHTAFGRSRWYGTRLNDLASFENNPLVPYELIIDLPKPRYERNILERDTLGRIVHSKPPEAPL